MRLSKQRGLSIVELMVALGLSALLATALYRIVMANQQSMRLTESYSQIQEAARTTFDLMSPDLRMAGYQGCVNNLDKVSYLLNTASTGYNAIINNYTKPIEVVDDYQAGDIDLSSVLPANVLITDNTDVFISRQARATDINVAQAGNATDTSFVVTGPTDQLDDIAVGMVMLVSDCQDTDIFAVSAITTPAGGTALEHKVSVTGGPDNLQATLTDASGANKAFPVGSQVLPMDTVIYFIGHKQGEQKNSLYRYSSLDGLYAVNKAQEMVPNIDDMQLMFSVDSNNDGAPDTYMTQTEIEAAGLDMAKAAFAVRISITVADDKACGKTGANSQTCINPQTYQQVIFIRNSQGAGNA